MKIGLLVQRFPGGGAEKYVEEIATRLSKDKIDVTVITSQNNHDDSKFGFKIIRLSSILKIGEYHIWKGLEKVLREEKFDVIHTNTYGYYHSDKAARLKKKLGYKLIMTSHGFHGTELHELKKNKIIDNTSPFDFLREIYDSKIGKKTILASDHLIALSAKEKNFYQNLGVEPSKITILPPGIRQIFFDNLQILPIKLDGVPNIVTVGELSWVKAKSLAINAMPMIMEKLPQAKLFVIGKDKDQLAQLKSLVEKLHLQNNVFFLGTLSEADMISYLKSADILVHTSLAEGLSTILLEAMAVGLPFITTSAGGNDELPKNSGAGVVTPFENPSVLSQNVLEIFDKQKLEQMRINAINYSANLGWDKIYPQILQIYYSLVSKQ